MKMRDINHKTSINHFEKAIKPINNSCPQNIMSQFCWTELQKITFFDNMQIQFLTDKIKNLLQNYAERKQIQGIYKQLLPSMEELRIIYKNQEFSFNYNARIRRYIISTDIDGFFSRKELELIFTLSNYVFVSNSKLGRIDLSIWEPLFKIFSYVLINIWKSDAANINSCFNHSQKNNISDFLKKYNLHINKIFSFSYLKSLFLYLFTFWDNLKTNLCLTIILNNKNLKSNKYKGWENVTKFLNSNQQINEFLKTKGLNNLKELKDSCNFVNKLFNLNDQKPNNINFLWKKLKTYRDNLSHQSFCGNTKLSKLFLTDFENVNNCMNAIDFCFWLNFHFVCL